MDLTSILYKDDSNQSKIRAAQEWLTLHGHKLVIDGIYGPATKQALIDYQRSESLPVTGEIDDLTLTALFDPIYLAIAPISTNGRSLSQMVIAYAKQHLAVHPKEVGGQNMGPWVRLYMDGKEGISWPWCAGFVSFLLKQACESLGRSIPFQTSPSCYLMAQSAMKKSGMYVFGRGKATGDLGDKLNGAIFFVRSPGKWSHTGIVLQALSESFYTIEGNTNDEGSAEGYEVCQRIRGYENKDFILLS